MRNQRYKYVENKGFLKKKSFYMGINHPDNQSRTCSYISICLIDYNILEILGIVYGYLFDLKILLLCRILFSFLSMLNEYE